MNQGHQQGTKGREQAENKQTKDWGLSHKIHLQTPHVEILGKSG